MTQDSPQDYVVEHQVVLGGRAMGVLTALVVIGLAALGAAFGLGWNRGDQLRQFSASYLVAFCYFLSISLGGLFFVALQHLVRAGWSVSVRRLAEIVAANVAWMALLFLPVVVPLAAGYTGLYEWSDPAAVEADALLRGKAAYLNVPAFAGRAAVYFVVWVLTAWYFLRLSGRQDAGGKADLTRRMERLSPVALILFALTVTFASFDWLMSLEPRWFSTIFGLYYYAGSVVAFLAALILLAMFLQRGGQLTRAITTEHYHDLGKLLLGFVIFWGYMAFSQYMLIWYANVPEESVWYLVRQTGAWAWVSVGLLFGNLLIPLVGLLSREVKRRKVLLGFWAVWLLAFHWVDLYWLVMPTWGLDLLRPGLIDLCCMMGVGCLYLAGLAHLARGRALLACGDPRLPESLQFENF